MARNVSPVGRRSLKPSTVKGLSGRKPGKKPQPSSDGMFQDQVVREPKHRVYRMNYQQYVESGVWRCVDSPTGAHHWVQMVQSERLIRQGMWYCIHCHDVKSMPTTYSSAIVFTRPWTGPVLEPSDGSG